LGESWDIIDTTAAEGTAPSAAAAAVDFAAIDKHAKVATVLYETELR